MIGITNGEHGQRRPTLRKRLAQRRVRRFQYAQHRAAIQRQLSGQLRAELRPKAIELVDGAKRAFKLGAVPIHQISLWKVEQLLPTIDETVTMTEKMLKGMIVSLLPAHSRFTFGLYQLGKDDNEICARLVIKQLGHQRA